MIIGLVVLAGAFFLLTKPKDVVVTPENTAVTPTNTPVETGPVTISWQYKQDGSIQPQSVRIKQGEKAVLTISSEVADEVHFHGYDLSKEVTPTAPAVIEFTAEKTGRFEVELEKAAKLLGVIEVYP